jgi:hypothetical protein
LNKVQNKKNKLDSCDESSRNGEMDIFTQTLCGKDCEMAMSMEEIKSESDLRRWLRENWDEETWGLLTWIEAASGGTPGAPDVMIPTQNFGMIPVELKVYGRGTTKKERMHVEIRPAQKRYHKLLRKKKLKSCFLSFDLLRPRSVKEGWLNAKMEIGVGLGFWVSEEPDGIHRLNALDRRRITTGAELRAVLEDQKFWEW